MPVFKIFLLDKVKGAAEQMLEGVNIDRKKLNAYPFQGFDQMLREFVSDVAVTGDKYYNDYLSGVTGGHLEFYDWITGQLRYRSEQPVKTLKWVNLPLGIDDYESIKPQMKIVGKDSEPSFLAAVHVTGALAEKLKTAFEFEEAVSRHAGIALTYLSVNHALQVYLNRKLNEIFRVIAARHEVKKAEEELKVEGKEDKPPKKVVRKEVV